MGSLNTGRLARRRWSAAGPLSTSVSFSAGPMVRIRFPPAVSLRTFGSGGELPPRDDIVPDAFLGQATVSKRQPTGGGLRVRIQFPPAESHANLGPSTPAGLGMRQSRKAGCG